MTKKIILSLGIILLISGCSLPPDAPRAKPITTRQLVVMQTHVFSSSKKNVYLSTINMLKQKGFNIKTSDLANGFISARSQSQTESDFIDDLIDSFFQDSDDDNTITKSTYVTCSVLLFSLKKKSTKVRINLILNTDEDADVGGGGTYSNQIKDAKSYQEMFKAIRKQIFISNVFGN